MVVKTPLANTNISEGQRKERPTCRCGRILPTHVHKLIDLCESCEKKTSRKLTIDMIISKVVIEDTRSLQEMITYDLPIDKLEELQQRLVLQEGRKVYNRLMTPWRRFVGQSFKGVIRIPTQVGDDFLVTNVRINFSTTKRPSRIGDLCGVCRSDKVPRDSASYYELVDDKYDLLNLDLCKQEVAKRMMPGLHLAIHRIFGLGWRQEEDREKYQILENMHVQQRIVRKNYLNVNCPHVDGDLISPTQNCDCDIYHLYDIRDNTIIEQLENAVKHGQIMDMFPIEKYDTTWKWLGYSKYGTCYSFRGFLIVLLLDKYSNLMNLVGKLCDGSLEVRNIDHRDMLAIHKLVKGYVKVDNYDQAAVAATLIGDKPRINIMHIHASRTSYVDIDLVRLYRNNNTDIYRTSEGYMAFGSDASVLERYCNDNPLQHQRYVEYIFDKCCSVDDMDDFIRKLKDNVTLCDETIYRQLVYCLSTGHRRKEVLNLLRMCHAIVYKEKTSTRCLVISGKPGVGKSKFAVSLVGVDDDVYYYRADPKAKKFWDGYYGQSTVVIDDLGHYNKDEWLILIQLISDTPVFVPMVDPQRIDRVPFCSPLIIITTNCLDKINELTSDTRRAIYRRIEILDLTYEYAEYRLYRGAENAIVPIMRMDVVQMLRWAENFKQFINQPVIKCDGNMVDVLVNGIHIMNKYVFPFLPYVKWAVPLINFILSGVESIVSTVVNPLLSLVGSHRQLVIPSSCKRLFYAMTHNARKKFMDELLSMYKISVVENNSALVEKHLLVAEAGGTLFANDVTRKHGPYRMFGHDVETPDLTPYVRREDVELNIYVPAAVDEFDLSVAEVFPDIMDIAVVEDGKLKIKRDEIRSTRMETRYYLEGLPDDLCEIYQPGLCNGIFARLQDKFISVRDERMWKPTNNLTTSLRRSVANEYIQKKYGEKSNMSKTQKRRMQRQHAKCVD